MHKCLNPACKAQIPHSKAACGPCWKLVPMPIASAVYAGYRKGRLSDAHVLALHNLIAWFREFAKRTAAAKARS